MNEPIQANGLTLQHIPSKAAPLSERTLEDLSTPDALIAIIDEHLKEDSFFVAYMDYRVIIGKYANKAFDFYPQEPEKHILPKYVQKLRIFNQNEELLFWRSGQMLKGRHRKDGKGDEEVAVIEAEQVLFGTKKGTDGNKKFTKITEDRGTTLILPFTGFDIDEGKQRLFIKTRNYIDYNAVNQATYIDCRFVSFANIHNDFE